jgi:hypothetical protein
LLGLVVVGLLVVAATLLILGLGVAVGIGLLLGMLLAFVAVLATMVASGRNPASGWSVSLSREDPDAMPGVLHEFGRASARVADVDSGGLTNVLAIADEATASGRRREYVLLAYAPRTTSGGDYPTVKSSRNALSALPLKDRKDVLAWVGDPADPRQAHVGDAVLSLHAGQVVFLDHHAAGPQLL